MIADLDRTDFVARFGGIYEHSSWVAETCFDNGLHEDAETPSDLAGPFARIVESAGHEPQLILLRAHPDLAGKLAQAKRLTAESTAEQASAGLDALTDDERAAFTKLNTRYVEKFGFPFIIAVKGRTKDEILAAFRTRIDNDRATEFDTACRQVERIALLRLKDLLPS